MRAIDDKIIYKLNTSVPTVSFADQVSAREQCKELYEQASEVQGRVETEHMEYTSALCCLCDIILIYCTCTDLSSGGFFPQAADSVQDESQCCPAVYIGDVGKGEGAKEKTRHGTR